MDTSLSKLRELKLAREAWRAAVHRFAKSWMWLGDCTELKWSELRLQPIRLLCPWNSPGRNTGVGCNFFLQGIFPSQGLNLALLHCRQILYHLNNQGRQMVNAFVVVLSLANARGKCLSRQVPVCSWHQRGMRKKVQPRRELWVVHMA